MNRIEAITTILLMAAAQAMAQQSNLAGGPATLKAAEHTISAPMESGAGRDTELKEKSTAASVVSAVNGAGAAAGQPVVAATLHTATTVVVTANPPMPEPGTVSSYTVLGKDVLRAAGSFQDLPRYLMALPGVTSGKDSSNALIVRGGNTFENLYVVDKMEVPNINHLALAGTSGGLVSMLDSNSIDSATFTMAAYDAGYDSRLSSVMDIHTLEMSRKSFNSVDAGFGGVGFRVMRPTGPNRSVLISARQSFINLFTSDIGLNGVPIFTNSMVKYQWNPSPTNHVWIDSVSGVDSLKMRPEPTDNWETNPYNTDYSGWRNTTGVVWQHTFDSDAIGTFVLGHSLQDQNLRQQDQMNHNQLIFLQRNQDELLQVKYDYLEKLNESTLVNVGADLHWNGIGYNVQQPLGSLSPYSANPIPQNAFSAKPSFSTVDDAAYINITSHLGERTTLHAGVRAAQWGYQQPFGSSSTTSSATSSSSGATCCCYGLGTYELKGKSALLPQATVSVRATKRLTLKASYTKNAQLPPYSLLASLPANNYLQLIHDRQIVAGADMLVTPTVSISLESYQKSYSNYPVSVDYPQLSLATVIPTLGEEFSLLPMTSTGKGTARGIELTARKNFGHHFYSQVNAAYSRAVFSGSDGVMRPSSNNLPVVMNATGGVTIRKYLITAKNSFTSGRTYTPVLDAESTQQDREIYDLSRLNALRGPVYNRLDLAMSRDFQFGRRVLEVHGGVQNALNRDNLYQYLWRPRCPRCGLIAEPQMGLMPDFGLSFHY